MNTRILIAVPLILGLAGCDSRLNPMNWFSKSQETVTLSPKDGFPEDIDRRTVIAKVTSLEVQRASGGAIITATGLPATGGSWNGELVAENDERPVDGVLTYSFRVAEPRSGAIGAPASVLVGHFVSDIRLREVRQIRVVGLENGMTARR